MVQYDGSVRNAVGEIVELVYGGDGLDPVNMEVKNKPVDMVRQLNHTRAVYPRRNENYLESEEIIPKMRIILNEPDYTASRLDFKTDIR